ncbi:MAG TPA: HGxxPAAW family protein [Streptosporangiaceae bacterium]|jgi:hypothetical protein|nr:HGxxPAAW family protein [Streptosporangiaceae bacterium]
MADTKPRNDRFVAGHTRAMSLHSTEPNQHGTAPGHHEPDERALGGHSQLHGRPSSWVLVAVVVAAFVVGGFAIVFHQWWLFWVCVGVVVLAVPVGKVVGIMGDTVLAGNPASALGQEPHVAEDMGSAAHPGVDVGVPGATSPDQR